VGSKPKKKMLVVAAILGSSLSVYANVSCYTKSILESKDLALERKCGVADKSSHGCKSTWSK